MKKILKILFYFTSRERNGTVVLAIIVIIVIGIRMWMAYGPAPASMPLDAEDLAQVKAFGDKLKRSNDFNEISADRENSPEESARTPVRGYKENSGNQAYSGSYRITEADRSGYAGGSSYKGTKEIRIEINRADTTELKALKGIGSVLAGRIVRYRKLLGGFYSVSQIREVYGISDSIFYSISHLMFADTSGIRKININEAVQYELSRHPYIGSYYAEGIIRYRDLAGKISGIDELLLNNLLPEGTSERIVNYLNF